ncbi:MAG: molybdopterin-dependent oxidoreductase [Pirellulales bacterium]
MTAKLPPGQQWAAPGRWPIVGERAPALRTDPWEVHVHGCVDTACTWSLAALQALPTVERQIDIHCVTRWSMPEVRWTGLPLVGLLDQCQLRRDARFVSLIACSERRHSTSLSLDDVRRLDPLVVWAWQGRPLEPAHGGPLRVIVPGKYFYKSLKWLAEIEVLAEDRLGYWEAEAGYHNEADPWQEQRFLAPELTRAESSRILVQRDLVDRSARGLDASGRDLSGLQATRAVLRDADFSRTQLTDADFSFANLSNARFRRSDLRRAKFCGADVEGADFRGADLRGVDFRGASLFGALLVGDGDAASLDPSVAAVIDEATQFDPAALDQLMPVQAEWLVSGRSRRRS